MNRQSGNFSQYSSTSILLFPCYSHKKRFFIESLEEVSNEIAKYSPKVERYILPGRENSIFFEKNELVEYSEVSFATLKSVLERSDIKSLTAFTLDINLLKLLYTRCRLIKTTVIVTLGGTDKAFLSKVESADFSPEERRIINSLSLMTNVSFVCNDKKLAKLLSDAHFKITESKNRVIDDLFLYQDYKNEALIKDFKKIYPCYDPCISLKEQILYSSLLNKIKKQYSAVTFLDLCELTLPNIKKLGMKEGRLVFASKENFSSIVKNLNKERGDIIFYQLEDLKSLVFCGNDFLQRKVHGANKDYSVSNSKLLTVIVPSYNVEKFLETSVLSLVNSNDLRLEVLIINDGSNDSTAEIAKKLQNKFSGMVRVINKENGGHGSAINVGIKNARGHYCKVVDGDDWLDSGELINFLDDLEDCYKQDIDLVLTDARRDFKNKLEMPILFSYPFLQPRKLYLLEELCESFGGFSSSACPRLHSSTFKTSLLKECADITEKCFFVDMELMTKALLRTKTFTYLNLDLFRYRSGYETQSVSPKSWAKNWKDHWRILCKLEDLINGYPLKDKRVVMLRRTILLPMMETQFRMFVTLKLKSELRQFNVFMNRNEDLQHELESCFSNSNEYMGWQYKNSFSKSVGRSLSFYISEKFYYFLRDFTRRPIAKTIKYILPYFVVRLVQKIR